MQQRLPAALEEGPARPENDGQRKHQFEPALRSGRHQAQAVSAHCQDRDHDRQRQRPPEAAGEVAQLRVVVVCRRLRDQRLQRHPALGAVARPILSNLRVHGTGVDRRARRSRFSHVGDRGRGRPQRGGGARRRRRLVGHRPVVMVFVCGRHAVDGMMSMVVAALGFGRGALQDEVHAAFRTTPGCRLLDLRVHRAAVLWRHVWRGRVLAVVVMGMVIQLVLHIEPAAVAGPAARTQSSSFGRSMCSF